MENPSLSLPDNLGNDGNIGAAGVPTQPEKVMPTCPCGKGVRQWSALDEQGYCSDECYYKGKVQSTTSARYVAHGIYESVEDK